MPDETQHQSFWARLRNTFGRGIVVLIPVIITLWVLRVLFDSVDGIILPFFDLVLGRRIPGLGFITMIALVLFVGAVSRNLFARAVFAFIERIIGRIPLARTIYTAMKDLFGAFQMGGKGKSFKQVVLVEYPRIGSFTIGFVTNEFKLQGPGPSQLVSVYVPNPPNPTSGFILFLPPSEMRILQMSVEEGLKLVLSGGIVSSGVLTVRS
jgi:uncharacterized membrane protein